MMLKVKIKFRVFAILLVAVLLVTLLPAAPVQAASSFKWNHMTSLSVTLNTSYSDKPRTYNFNDYIEDIFVQNFGVYSFVYEPDDRLYSVVLSDEEFTFTRHRIQSLDGTITSDASNASNVNYRKSYNGFYYYLLDEPLHMVGTVLSYNISVPYVTISGGYSNVDKAAEDFLDKLIGASGDMSKMDGYHDADFEEGGNAEYDPDLGYLQNVNQNTLSHGSINSSSFNVTLRYTYGYTTTTGFDLRSDGADVQYLFKIKGGYTTFTGKYYDLPDVDSGYFYAGHGKDYFDIDNDTFNDLLIAFRTDDVPLTSSLTYSHYVFLRPVYSDGTVYKYGGWSRLHSDGSGGWIIDNGTTSSGDVFEDDDFHIDDSYTNVGNVGNGLDPDDAFSNARPSDGSGGLGMGDLSDYDFEGFLDSAYGFIGNVPNIIASVWAAFPSAVIGLIALGFAIAVVCRILGR